jgi:hypothetical protein
MSKRTPPEPPPQLTTDLDFEDFGPDFQALKPKHRLFVWYLAHNGGDAADAYRMAYPKMTSDLGCRVNGSKLRARQDIRRAMAALGKYQFMSLTHSAIQALGNVLANPSHKQYLKAAEYVLDRSGYQPEQMVVHKHEHTHKLAPAEQDAKLQALATLLGVQYAPMKEAPTLPPPADPIDVAYEEIPNASTEEEW